MATDSNAGEEEAQSSSYVELAVQYSPSNPAAAWFWQPSEQILNSHVKVRIGGGFVWPPSSGIPTDQIKKVVFVAGGVGIKYVYVSFLFPPVLYLSKDISAAWIGFHV